MIINLLIVFITLIVYEFLNYFNFKKIIKSTFRIYRKIFELIKSRKIFENKKEKIVIFYSKILFLNSTKILFVFISIIALILILDQFFNSLLESIFNFSGILISILVFFIYHKLRKLFNGKL